MYYVPTIFYFDSADKLAKYKSFEVNKKSFSIDGRELFRFDIVAISELTNELELLAEFGAESNAHAFRDMAEITSVHFK